MKRNLVLKADAPDEVEIAVGTEFKKHFKRSDEPFGMTDEDADMLLRSTDYFKEVPAKKEANGKTKAAKPPAPKATKTAAKTAAKTATKKTEKTATETVAAPVTDKPAAANSSESAEDVPAKEIASETTDK